MALEALTNLDLTLLSLHWVGIENGEVAVLRGDGQLLPTELAENLVDKAWDKISRLCANRGYRCAYIYAEGNNGEPKRYRVPADFSASLSESAENSQVLGASDESSTSTFNPDTILTIPEQELTLNALERSPLATYINAIKTQKKFYANSTALTAQGKPPEDFLDGNAYDLNEPDELDYRTSRIASGEALRAYEYEGWRWYFDANAGRFRLKRMQLVSNFRLLRSFNGVPCWLGQVLQATELTRRQL
jgi:hypothetical protein